MEMEIVLREKISDSITGSVKKDSENKRWVTVVYSSNLQCVTLTEQEFEKMIDMYNKMKGAKVEHENTDK